MKSMLIAIFAAGVLCAQVPDAVLRRIGPETRWVYGGDIAQYRRSAWQQAAAWYIDGAPGAEVERVVRIAGPAADPILIVTAPAAPLPELPKTDTPLSETALKVKRLAESFDVWFLVLRPLEHAGFANPKGYGKELLGVIQEVSGGMRLGPHTELHLEVVADTPENASTLAGVARWVPGFLALQEHGPYTLLVDLVEGLSIRAEGARVTISGYVSENRVRDAVEAWRKRGAIE